MRSALGLLLLGALTACKPQPLPGEARDVQEHAPAVTGSDELGALSLARIGSAELRYADWEMRADLASLPIREQTRLSSGRHELLQSLLRVEAMAQDALRRGMVRDDEVRFHESLALARATARGAFRPAALSEEEEEALWVAQSERVRLPERVELTIFSFSEPEAAERHLLDFQRRLRTSAKAPALEVADILRERRGDAGSRHVDLGFVSAATLEVPDVLVPHLFPEQQAPAVRFLPEVIRDGDAWLVVWAGLRFPEVDVEREDALVWLREQAYRAARAAMAREAVDALHTQHQVVIDTELLERVATWRAENALGAIEPERPRWFSEAMLRDDARAFLGEAEMLRMEEAFRRRGTLEDARARVNAAREQSDEWGEAPSMDRE